MQCYVVAGSLDAQDAVGRNDLDATAGTRDENGRWIRETIDYAEIADFRFEPPTVGFALGHRWPELASLFLWLALSAALLHLGTRRIPVAGTAR